MVARLQLAHSRSQIGVQKRCAASHTSADSAKPPHGASGPKCIGTPNRYFELALIPRRWRIGQIFPHSATGLQLAAVFENQNGGGRKLLGNRPKPELRGGRVRDLPLGIREPVTLAQEHFIAADRTRSRPSASKTRFPTGSSGPQLRSHTGTHRSETRGPTGFTPQDQPPDWTFRISRGCQVPRRLSLKFPALDCSLGAPPERSAADLRRSAWPVALE